MDQPRSEFATGDITPDGRFVLFADMLGFAALVEAHPLDVAMLNTYNRPLSAPIEIFLEGRRNPLTVAFHGFHSSLRSAIDMSSGRNSVTAITFSDSAFVAFARFDDACRLAVDLMRSTLPYKVPVRIGIAYGSFAALARVDSAFHQDAHRGW